MLIRILPIVLAAAIFSAATCVTSFDAQGPSGPWTGEFKSYHTYDTSTFEWQAKIVDANGVDAPQITMNFCPHAVPAGGTGAFEMVVSGGQGPFTAQAPIIEAYGGLDLSRQHALLTATMTRWTGSARAEVFNGAEDVLFTDLVVCGVSRNSTGKVLAVSPEVRPAGHLLPGDREAVDLELSRYAGIVDVYVTGVPVELERENHDGSIVIDTGPFDVTLPEGWVYTPRQGIDSFVGDFRKGDVHVFFDYGWYSGNLMEWEDDPAYNVSHETIDGREATVVRPEGSASGVTAAHVIVGGVHDAGAMQTTILLYADDVPSSLRAEVLGIYRSLRFEEGP